MDLTAPNTQLFELLFMLGRISLIVMILGITYHAYWRFHPERTTLRK